MKRETDIHEQNKKELAAENLSTTTRLNTEYGAKIKGIADSIAIQERHDTSTSTETTPHLGDLTNSVLSKLKADKGTEEANQVQALHAENERYVGVLEVETTRFNQKSQQEQTKFKSRLFDYALTRQIISKLRVIMQGYISMKQGINESESKSKRSLDETQINTRKVAEDNIFDIKEKIITIESIQKAMYPYSRSAYKTFTNKSLLGIGSLLGKPTGTKAMRSEITGIDTLPLEKVVSLVFTGKESLDSAVQTLMQDYVSIILTKSAALPNAKAKGYIAYLTAKEVLAQTTSLTTGEKSRSNSQSDSKIDGEAIDEAKDDKVKTFVASDDLNSSGESSNVGTGLAEEKDTGTRKEKVKKKKPIDGNNNLIFTSGTIIT